MTNKKKWLKIYLEMAEVLATGSRDSKMKVGCLILSDDLKQIYSSGVNGGPTGLYNRRINSKRGKSGFLCAELNSVLKNHYWDHLPKILVTTHTPCNSCSMLIVNLCNIKEVYYKYDYPSKAFELLKKAGIKLCKLR
jgi:deoxycytidylate deaminase